MATESGVAKNKEAYNRLVAVTASLKKEQVKVLFERLSGELRSLSFSEAKHDVLCTELKTELFGDAQRRIPGKLNSPYYRGLEWYPYVVNLIRQDEERVSVFDQEYNVLLKFAIDVAEAVNKLE